jgi:hypothetical protein
VLVRGFATLGKTLPRSVGLHFSNQPDVRAFARDLAGGTREPVSVRAAIADDIDADGVFRRGGLAPVGRQRCRYHRHHFTSGHRLEVGTEQLRPFRSLLRESFEVIVGARQIDWDAPRA